MSLFSRRNSIDPDHFLPFWKHDSDNIFYGIHKLVEERDISSCYKSLVVHTKYLIKSLGYGYTIKDQLSSILNDFHCLIFGHKSIKSGWFLENEICSGVISIASQPYRDKNNCGHELPNSILRDAELIVYCYNLEEIIFKRNQIQLNNWKNRHKYSRVKRLGKIRALARKNKWWKLADQYRTEIERLGYKIRDHKDNTYTLGTESYFSYLDYTIKDLQNLCYQLVIRNPMPINKIPNLGKLAMDKWIIKGD